ncbi:MAG: SUF system Fe-S cluster assembly regulator [Planctomycetota bacterium]|nr:SUF system Fe-S cluster assembly regulator [Planctomycetota bacterium]
MLRLTRQADYAIVLMTHFAGAPEKKVQNARDLAKCAGLPLPTVSKTLKALGRAGLLVSYRGVKGGYSLPRPAEEITVAEIIEATEGPIALTECLDTATDECGIEFCCPVRTNWQRINQAVRDALRNIPLSDMATTVTFPPLEKVQ